ncbi:MAG: aspartate aminotransferase family protein [Planktomarina sp.]|jgi:4-aminobutyrate aminotransferase-like enzyme|nr:aspartate aminotransferase family protein [Planktomarina sp.]MDT2057320.1 aspartate aminotransferase family protein [Planktomarina sp.]MDT2073382.1 aspartate aminotransferase family protein [Planktomarina sp.]MDT2077543.1 aspartate aminotransferase family protein [Planktomarina sp.]HAJ84998.1 aspartate aminotransferase family protein [Paracoccaceae bacterium]|tara:strand:+ start:4504 stop:5769 length:1266 start_codon:yes stop_codon:yes gene_type:complete
MTNDLMARRESVLGSNVPTFYEVPLHLVRGQGVWVWDDKGQKYLDCYNNVPHVGHCHPHVVAAISEQAATLNIHTRYLHDGIIEFAERLTAKFQSQLDQVIMVCSGSEANDIALRMAQAMTGKTGIISTDNTYHGNTMAVSQLSSRKPPIGGYAANIRHVPAPDTLRPVGGSTQGQAEAFAHEIQIAIDDLEVSGHGFSGFLFCPTFANEGLPDLPQNFMKPAAKVIHAAGGILIADEVQPGFGRSGDTWWGHDWLGLSPDVVTLGKPMANGHPVAAVVARAKVMSAFRNAFGYFNTFGGNPVSCAAAAATLDVIEQDNLVENAKLVGAEFLQNLHSLDHESIASTRGRGLFIALELETDGVADEALAAHVVEYARNNGMLMGRTGRNRNVLKLRPPMPFSSNNATLALDILKLAFQNAKS